MRILYFLLLSSFLTFSCKHESVADAFVFTTYGCYCVGNCISGYKLTETGLFKGEGNKCDPSNLSFEKSPLSADKQALGQALRDAFPAELLDSTEDTYGCPDCGDWGGHYIEWTQNGTTRTWNLDALTDNLSGDVKIFVEALQQTMRDLQ